MQRLLLLEEMVNDYFWGKTKSEALNRMKNANLSKKADNYNYIKKIVYYSDVKQYTRD